MLKKKVDSNYEYIYQWMNKYKDDADRRLKLLNRVDTMWQGGLTEEQGRKLCDELREELDDAKK